MTVRAIDVSGLVRADEVEKVQHETPASGATITVASDTTQLVIEPAGALLALTINFPSNPSRGDGHKLGISVTQSITALTIGAGAGNTLAATLTAASANGAAEWVYRSNKWYRC